MKAAIIHAEGAGPVYGDFAEPTATSGTEIVTVRASALSQLSKSRSSGRHYSSDAAFPAVAGVDGVGITADGRRVYFVMPVAPCGALAEKTLARPELTVELDDSLDDVTAAALANPGMSSWAALRERAALKPGETVLVHGATGSAGRLAVQIAKHLGAAKVIATGRSVAELEELKALGADVVVPFEAGASAKGGGKLYEEELTAVIGDGVDVVVDYLWGATALTIMAAIAKAAKDARPVRFVQVGAAAGEDTIELPSAALRSSSIQLMGSGLKSVPMPRLLDAIRNVFAVARTADLQIATRTFPLTEVAEAWAAPSKPRVVVTI